MYIDDADIYFLSNLRKDCTHGFSLYNDGKLVCYTKNVIIFTYFKTYRSILKQCIYLYLSECLLYLYNKRTIHKKTVQIQKSKVENVRIKSIDNRTSKKERAGISYLTASNRHRCLIPGAYKNSMSRLLCKLHHYSTLRGSLWWCLHNWLDMIRQLYQHNMHNNMHYLIHWQHIAYIT